MNFQEYKFLSTFPRRERRRSAAAAVKWKVFLSTFPRRERLVEIALYWLHELFLSTFPRRERRCNSCTTLAQLHFYPRSHVGNDLFWVFIVSSMSEFLSTFPRRERLRLHSFFHLISKFLSTFPRRERHQMARLM